MLRRSFKKPVPKKEKKILIPKIPKANFIQKAVSKMKAKGTLGKFSREAKKEGESTLEHAKEIKNSPASSPKLKKEAQFAINMSKLRKKKK
jgi:hypothetical protein